MDKYITIPSKLNSLTMSQIEYMYPDKEIPLYPRGITKDGNRFVARKGYDGKLSIITKNPSPIKAIICLERFCDENGLHIK